MTAFTEHFPSEIVDVVGALELEPVDDGVRIRRLPAWTRPQIPDAVADFVLRMTSGVRLEFRTAATELKLDVSAITPMAPGGEPPVVNFELVADHRPRVCRSLPPADVSLMDGTGTVWHPGRRSTVRFSSLPAGEKDIEIWLPHTSATELHALHSSAPLLRATPDSRLRWLHHGSSISQGGEAASPLGTWPVVAARRAGVRLHNLGFSGNSVADPYVARTMRDLPADIISVEVGINIVNGDVMRRRAFGPAVHGFLDTLRERHRDTPIVLITPIPCPAVETLPGPTSTEAGRTYSVGDPRQLALGALSLTGIREELERVVRGRQDPRLSLLDGHRLLRPDESADLDDGLHPNSHALRRMGQRFAEIVFGEPRGRVAAAPVVGASRSS